MKFAAGKVVSALVQRLVRLTSVSSNLLSARQPLLAAGSGPFVLAFAWPPGGPDAPQGGQPYYQPPRGPSYPCKEANDALIYAIIGIFCCGIILEPIAISKALTARRLCAANPNLEGDGKAVAALVIACVGLGLWALGVIARLAAFSSMPR